MELPTRRLEDPQNDEVGKFIREFRKHTRWTKEKHLAWAELEQKLVKTRYQFFWARAQLYGLGPKGDGYLYEVPSTQRGFLSTYRGHLVRLVVAGHSRTERKIMVGLFNRDFLQLTLTTENN